MIRGKRKHVPNGNDSSNNEDSKKRKESERGTRKIPSILVNGTNSNSVSTNTTEGTSSRSNSNVVELSKKHQPLLQCKTALSRTDIDTNSNATGSNNHSPSVETILNSSPTTNTSACRVTKEYKSKGEKRTDKDEMSHSLNSGSDDEGSDDSNLCSICLCVFKDQPVGKPSTCNHYFCRACIEKWAQDNNTCPVDRQLFSSIEVFSIINGTHLLDIPVLSRRKFFDVERAFSPFVESQYERMNILEESEFLLSPYTIANHSDRNDSSSLDSSENEYLGDWSGFSDSSIVFGESDEESIESGEESDVSVEVSDVSVEVSDVSVEGSDESVEDSNESSEESYESVKESDESVEESDDSVKELEVVVNYI